MAEIPFENLSLAIETTRGTAIAAPTHMVSLVGTLTPATERARPNESRGILAEVTRSKTVQRWANLEAEGPLDTRSSLLWATMTLDGTPAAPTVITASQVWLWGFLRQMTVDDLDSATVFFGDPNVQIFRGAYGMLEEWTITADASGTDVVTQSLTGWTHFPVSVAAPTFPAYIIAPLLVPADMQLWLDTSSAIGTTLISGRVISAEVTIPTGVTRKWLATGGASDLNYARTGREKAHPEMTLVFEFLDGAQYNIFAGSDSDTIVRARLRMNGPVIETTNRHYIEVDIYGPFDSFAWGENQGSNRTLELTIMGEYDATLGSDLAMRIQTNTGTI